MKRRARRTARSYTHGLPVNFPAETPKYAIVVLVEGGESGSDTAAPIFKEIADEILLREM